MQNHGAERREGKGNSFANEDENPTAWTIFVPIEKSEIGKEDEIGGTRRGKGVGGRGGKRRKKWGRFSN